jgi:hypothetical protein
MNPPPALLAAFPPSAHVLLDVTRRQVDDSMLVEIAEADYLSNRNEHLAALRPIRDHGIVPIPLDEPPAEVLQLIRWSDPENRAPKPGSTGRRGHQMRAFACAVLLRAEMESYSDSVPDATLAQCLVSAKVLDEQTSEAAARFLTWAVPRVGPNDNMLFFALGLLIVATRLRAGRFEDVILGDTADWVLAQESELRELFGFDSLTPFLPYGIGFWEQRATELIHEAAEIRTASVRDTLEFIGAMMLDPA